MNYGGTILKRRRSYQDPPGQYASVSSSRMHATQRADDESRKLNFSQNGLELGPTWLRILLQELLGLPFCIVVDSADNL